MQSRTWGGFIVALGLGITASSIWHITTLDSYPPFGFEALVDLLMITGSGVTVIYGGYWHSTVELPAEFHGRIAGWMLAGGLLLGSLGVITLYTGSISLQPDEILESVHLMASVGLALGLLTGSLHAQAVVNAEIAARAEERAERMEAEYRRLTRLNSLLQHFVRNGVNIIQGYADTLRPAQTPADERAIDTITDRAQSLVALIERFASLPTIRRVETERTETDLVGAIEAALSGLTIDPSVAIDSPEQSSFVYAHPSFPDALSLLFDVVADQTEHDGAITIAVHPDPSGPSITISGSPAVRRGSIRDVSFEPIDPEAGLKLFIAESMLDPYADLRRVDDTVDTLTIELSFEAASSNEK